MNPITKTIAAAAIISATAAAQAQYHPTQQKHGHVKTLFNETDSVAIYDELLANAPSEFGSHVPRFAVIGKDHTFYFGIGGKVITTASYDFGHPVDDPNMFITSEIPTGIRPGNGGRVQFSAQQTHLCLNFVGLPGTANKFGAFVSMNLLSDNYAPELQYAYVKYRGLKAGYDKTLFADPASTPPSIDYEGVNASSCLGNAILDYSASFGKKKEWSAGVGLEMPLYSITDADVHGAYKVNQRVPDIPAFIRWSWDEGSGWLRLSAVMRNMLYHNPSSGKNVDKVGYGFQLSGSAQVLPGLTAYYQGLYGKGIASYIQDLAGCGMDMAPSAYNPYILDTVKAWGAYGALQYDFSPSVFASASYSHVRTYAKGCVPPSADNQYRYAQYAAGNLFWNITPILQTGVEYIYGRRVNYDGTQAHDSRLQAMLSLSF